MRNIILLVLLLLAFIFANGQKCEVSKDAFSGNSIVTFDYRAGTIKFDLQEDNITMQIKAGYSGDFDYPIEEGTPILFKFSNDEVLELKTIEQATPNTNVVTVSNSVVTITNYYFIFPVSKEEITKFSSHDVTVMRYPDAHGGTQDLEGKRIKKFAKAIKNGSACILENIL